MLPLPEGEGTEGTHQNQLEALLLVQARIRL